MSTFEDLKKTWNANRDAMAAKENYDRPAMEKIIRDRTKKQKNIAMQYFWASFTLQLLVYGLLSHVMITNHNDSETLAYSIGGVVLFIPFTVMLMTKYKAMAKNRPETNQQGVGTPASLLDYVVRQHTLLKSFYVFKKRYEIMLVPLSTALGTFLVFKFYVPGGVMEHLTGAMIAFLLTIASCAYAIYSENRKHFQQPLEKLEEILNEYRR